MQNYTENVRLTAFQVIKINIVIWTNLFLSFVKKIAGNITGAQEGYHVGTDKGINVIWKPFKFHSSKIFCFTVY